MIVLDTLFFYRFFWRHLDLINWSLKFNKARVYSFVFSRIVSAITVVFSF